MEPAIKGTVSPLALLALPLCSPSPSAHPRPLLLQLLTEMDGMNAKKTVFIIGATNRCAALRQHPCCTAGGKLHRAAFVAGAASSCATQQIGLRCHFVFVGCMYSATGQALAFLC